jgi:hypothetical protein
MSSWEKFLEEHRQEETFRKRCYQRLMKLKAEWKEARDLEKRLEEVTRAEHIQHSGFQG